MHRAPSRSSRGLARRSWPLAAAAMLLATACRGPDVSFDCDNQQAQFERVAGAEHLELGAIPTERPWPMAVHLSEDGLNRLLDAVIDQGVPLAGEVPFGILPQGPGDASFEPRDEPRILLQEVPGCPSCVVFALDFSVGLTAQGEPVSSGGGYAELAIPLRLEADEDAGTTTLVADYGMARIDAWRLSVFGFNSEEHDSLAGAVRRLLEEEIQREFGPVELLTLGRSSIGQGDLRVLAREVAVLPEQRKVVLAMTTNLPVAGRGVDLEAPLPEESPMMVSFATDFMLAITHRMFTEGSIARRYDEDGAPDPEGTYGLTVTDIGPEPGLPSLRTEFRVWRIEEGYCGRAALTMPLQLEVEAGGEAIAVRPGPAIIIPGHPDNEGVGVAAEEDAALVAENQDLLDHFRQELQRHLADTLNYQGIGVEGSRILFETEAIAVGERSVDSAIDFVVFARE